MNECFASLAEWRELLNNDFNRGYILGVGVVLTVILLILFLKIVFAMLLRTRRCREITVRAADGDTLISYAAIEDTLRHAMIRFPAFNIHEVKLFRRGKAFYFLELYCHFDTAAGPAFPQQSSEAKKLIFETLSGTFGIESVRQVKIRLEGVGIAKETGREDDSVAEVPPINPGF
ncbi:MAG: hypothetical protein AB7F32_11970 [Victivallaceae bacterium]